MADSKRKDRAIYMTQQIKRLISVAVCFVLVIAITAFAGIRQGWFAASDFTVTLDNGDSIVYQKGSTGVKSFVYDFEINSRALTKEEFIKILYPNIDDTVEGIGTFSAETNELIRLEGKFGNVHIQLAQSGIPVSDVQIEGNETQSVVNGIPVKSGYFITKANSKGIKTIIFFAKYTHDDVTVYVELAGNEEDDITISEQLSEIIYSLILNGSPDLSVLTFDS